VWLNFLAWSCCPFLAIPVAIPDILLLQSDQSHYWLRSLAVPSHPSYNTLAVEGKFGQGKRRFSLDKGKEKQG
jgi:hypothetical protein